MFVAVFNLLHNKGIRGNLQLLSIGGLIRRKLNRRACHHRRRTFCLLEFRHAMSAPARQAPMIHVVQLVRPSRLCSGTSGRLSGCSSSFDSASFGGILASPAGRGGTTELRTDSLAARSASSILAFGRQQRHAHLLLSLGLLLSCFNSSPKLGQELLGPSLFPPLPPSVGSPSSFIV